jgi:hypothetical protein
VPDVPCATFWWQHTNPLTVSVSWNRSRKSISSTHTLYTHTHSRLDGTEPTNGHTSTLLCVGCWLLLCYTESESDRCIFPLALLLLGVCVCSLCSTQRENLCCVPRPLLYVLTQEEEEGGAGGSVWVDWPTHTEEREERAGVDVRERVEEKINGSGGGPHHHPVPCPMMNVALSRFMVVSLLHLARHSTEKGRTRSLFLFSPRLCC